MDTRNIGLRNIEVADTKICSIDGENGKLIYRGYDILDLANHSTYEETAFLLLFGDLPVKEELEDFNLKLTESRRIPDSVTKNMKNKPVTAHPMDVLQSSILDLADYDRNRLDEGKIANIERAISLIAKIPTIVAAWDRIRNKQDIVEPRDDNSHAHNFLYMLRGEHPKHEISKIFDISLILHAEHSFNASTFAAREIASTRASIYASIGGAVGALSGELHGGANIQVMKMLLEMGDLNNVEKWVHDRIAKGGRVMGMGHAVYRTTDPRSEVLASLSRAISKEKDTKWYEMTEKIEEITRRVMYQTRKMLIYPNVDLYSASLYYSLGIPIDLNTPIFAISRIAGWNAHIIEEKFAEAAPKPALYRPKAVYVGRYCGPMGCEYVSLINRKIQNP
ncbi:citrate/2-methylcitrate synthase [Candidatus Nitrosocosmicus arcticus]|uniref:Citrate synthase n=1 Tax=Candidatus Nitrosocosmicus arcticus TaxID=2035267 RepID=A0A557SYI2_9ARCH|nr:citrate/2-methylcitrate synthase [Candidatus Nitrosocosmicus arcticus]TVP41653.1 citrate synthase [Candidatus Nitrosocosmicus arcticus]